MQKEKENDKKDLTKYFGIFLTSAGVLLWTSGYSFSFGFWTEAGLPQAFIPTSLQETIMRGIFPVDNWTGLITFLFGYGAFFLIFAFVIALLQSKFKKQRKEQNSKEPASEKQTTDATLTQTGIALVAAASGMAVLLLIFAVWAVAAEQQGKTEFRKTVCENQDPTTWKEKVILEDKSELRGSSLTIADGLTVLMTDTELHVVNIRTGPKIVQSVRLPKIECTKEFPPKKELRQKSSETSSPSTTNMAKSLLNALFLALSLLSAIFWFQASRTKITNDARTDGKDKDETNDAIQIVKLQIQRNKIAAAIASAAAVTQVVLHFLA